MDRGKIIERGTHKQLLATGGLYSQLYETQFRGKIRFKKTALILISLRGKHLQFSKGKMKKAGDGLFEINIVGQNLI